MKRKDEPRPISDHDFNEELDEVVETTIRLFQQEEHDDYAPVAFLSDGEHLDVMSLDDEDDDAPPATPTEAEMPALAREFGESLAGAKDKPQCVFFAHLSKADDGVESIVVHGATPDGRTNTAHLNMTRDKDGHLRVASSKAWHCPAPFNPPMNHAAELLKGMTS